jgi:DNA-binding transcriptional ArsR family regulator
MPDDLAVLSVLADPTRRALLGKLRGKLLPVGELARQMPISRPAVSQHLKILKDAQLVREHRQGTRHYFGLDAVGFAGLREYADWMWQEALNAFATYVAEQTSNTKKRRDTKKATGTKRAEDTKKLRETKKPGDTKGPEETRKTRDTKKRRVVLAQARKRKER